MYTRAKTPGYRFLFKGTTREPDKRLSDFADDSEKAREKENGELLSRIPPSLSTTTTESALRTEVYFSLEFSVPTKSAELSKMGRVHQNEQKLS